MLYKRLTLRKSYLFLLVLAITLTLFSFLFGVVYEVEWLSAYLSNIATGVAGSLIIVFLVDKIVERDKKQQRARIVKMALRRLKLPISKHMELLCHFYKASAQDKPSLLPSTFQEVFVDDYYKEILWLDFSKDSPLVNNRWLDYAWSKAELLIDKLEQVEDTYFDFLDVDLIGLLERVTNSKFLNSLASLGAFDIVQKFSKKAISTRILVGLGDMMREHITLMLELIDYCNSRADSKITLNQDIWMDDAAPKWGDSRYSD